MAKPNVVSKQKLIEATQDCIVELGIEKLTLRAVAEKAKVTQGTVYYHFQTKEQLLFEVVQEMCRSSWQEMSHLRGTTSQQMKQALQAAQARCTYDSFYHRLFYSLMVLGFHNERIRTQLGELLQEENDQLTKKLAEIREPSPIDGISAKTWSILLNAVVDGLAIQALLSEDFPTEEVYRGLEKLISAGMGEGNA